MHTKSIPVATGVDLAVLARGTPGFSGADLSNLVNEAALYAARQHKTQVDMRDFESAKDKVMMGVERRSLVISDEEKRVTAYHEGGHTFSGQVLLVQTLFIKSRLFLVAWHLGLTQQLPTEENSLSA